MKEHEPFTFFTRYMGATHENLHIYTALFVSALLALSALTLYPRLKQAAHNVIPDSGITLKSIYEMLMDMVVGLCDDIIGPGGRKYVPFVGTIFFFIFACNLIGLVPGFLPATENWATGAAVATIVFIAFNYFGFREHGLGYFKHFLAPVSMEGIKNVVLYSVAFIFLLLFQVLFGSIELISLAMRPLTLSIRLYVNILADHIVGSIFSGMIPFLLPIPFLILGMLVAFVQAFVFTLLTIVYISLATAHDH